MEKENKHDKYCKKCGEELAVSLCDYEKVRILVHGAYGKMEQFGFYDHNADRDSLAKIYKCPQIQKYSIFQNDGHAQFVVIGDYIRFVHIGVLNCSS